MNSSSFIKMKRHVLETSQRELESFTLKMATGKVGLEGAVKWFAKHGS